MVWRPAFCSCEILDPTDVTTEGVGAAAAADVVATGDVAMLGRLTAAVVVVLVVVATPGFDADVGAEFDDVELERALDFPPPPPPLGVLPVPKSLPPSSWSW